jgi:hypothetical protein
MLFHAQLGVQNGSGWLMILLTLLQRVKTAIERKATSIGLLRLKIGLATLFLSADYLSVNCTKVVGIEKHPWVNLYAKNVMIMFTSVAEFMKKHSYLLVK